MTNLAGRIATVSKRIVWFVAVLVVVGGLLSCAKQEQQAVPQNKAARDPRNILLSHEGADRKVGEAAAEEVKSEMGLYEDPSITKYVNTLGRRLVAYAPRRSFDYKFLIVDQDIPNAFALPGGFIYLSRGLLALSNSEDELANVLSHEISHVAARHASGRQTISQRGKLLGLPGAVLGAVFGENVGERVAKSITLTNPGYIAAYSRAQENAADRVGQKTISRAGFDPGGLASFLQGLEATVRLKFGRSRIPGFFDTHPTTPRRAAAASSYAQTLSWSRRRGIAEDRRDFLSKLDGLIVGENPAEGIFRGDRFLHSGLKFSLQFPKGWEVQNTRHAVNSRSSDRKSTFVLEMDSEGQDAKSAANNYVITKAGKQGFQPISGRSIRLGTLDAFRLSGKATAAQNRILDIEMTFIAFGGRIYRVTGTTQEGVFARHKGTFRSAVRSFRALTKKELESIQVTRLKISRAKLDETLSDLSKRTGNTWTLQKTAVFNGLSPNASLDEGQMVKVALQEPYNEISE